jgi:hypothetical protein
VVAARVEAVLEAAEEVASEIRQDAQAQAQTYLAETRRKADRAAAERMRELAILTDNLVRRANEVARQSDELLTALDQAERQVLGPAAGDASPGAGNGRHPAEAEPAREPEREPEDPAGWQPRGAIVAARGAAAVTGPERAAAPAPTADRRPPSEQPEPEPGSAPRPRPVRPAPPPPRSDSEPQGARLLATQMALAGSSRTEIVERLRGEFGIGDPDRLLSEIGV